MKAVSILSLVATVLASKVAAECFSEKLGYPCCKENFEVYYVDDDGEWGVENNDWCGIEKQVKVEDNPSNNNNNNNNWPFGGNNDWNPWGQTNNAANPWGQQNNAAANPWDQGNNNNNWNPWGQQNNNAANPWDQGNNNNNWNPWGQQNNNNAANPWDQGNNNNNWNPWGQQNNNNAQTNPWGQQNNNNAQTNPWEQQNNNNAQSNPWGQQNNNNDNQNNNDNSQSNNQNSNQNSNSQSSVDCSGKTLKSNTTLNINGRKVIVKFPNGFKGDKATPLLINFHPIMGSASQWESGSQTAKAALNDGAIVAFMDGAQGPMGQAWNVGPCCTDADDVQYTRNFIKEITSQACVDPKRIYAAGFSMGGGMSNYAGCYLADVIAASAPSAFDLAKEIVDAGKCKPARPYPILNFRGTQDNVVMYNGGLSQVVQGKPITFMGAQNNFKEWAKMNGCTGEPKKNTPGNNCEMYENCKDGVKVGLCTINGGGHSEGDGKMGWDFLKQFTLP